MISPLGFLYNSLLSADRVMCSSIAYTIETIKRAWKNLLLFNILNKDHFDLGYMICNNCRERPKNVLYVKAQNKLPKYLWT